MCLRISKTLCSAVAIGIIASAAAAQQSVKLTTVWTAKTVNDPEHIKYSPPGGEVRALRLYAGTPRADHPTLPPKPLPPGAVFDPNSPAVRDPTNFWLMTAQEEGKKAEPVKFILIPEPNSQIVNDLIFVPLKQPKKGVIYRVVPGQGKSLDRVLVSNYKIENQDDFLKADVSNKFEEADISYIDGNKALEPSISFQSGKDSTATLKLFYGHQAWSGSNKLRFQSRAEVEGTYKPKQQDEYVAKVDGEIDFLYLMTDVPPGGTVFHALWETGLNANIQSDQFFNNVNQTVGWSNFLAFNGTALQSLAQVLCLNGDLGGNAPSALMTLSYELVQTIKEDDATHQRKIDKTTDRLRAHLYWSTKILKEVRIAQLWNQTDRYDLDLVIDSGAAYDFQAEKFTPDVNLSVELGPSTLDKSKPSLTLTYVNGKTSANFQKKQLGVDGSNHPLVTRGRVFLEFDRDS